MIDVHLVHGCRGVSLPHFERFGSSQLRKPDSTNLVAPEAVVEEHGGVTVDVLRSRRSATSSERRDRDQLTLKSSRKNLAGSNPGLLSALENFICCPVSTPWTCTDAFSCERGRVGASRWTIKSYSAVGCAFRIYGHDQPVSYCPPGMKRTETSLKL